MNIQHSMRTDEWYTPPSIIADVFEVMGSIDLDPASNLFANNIVKAKSFISSKDDALAIEWDTKDKTIYLNPPGGKRGNRSLSQLFWDKLITYRGDFKQAIFMGFSLECLQTTQRSELSVGSFPLCIPSKRIKFIDCFGVEQKSPSHSNVIAYLPGSVDNSKYFAGVFSKYGVILNMKETP